jgi:hypothetical protein
MPKPANAILVFVHAFEKVSAVRMPEEIHIAPHRKCAREAGVSRDAGSHGQMHLFEKLSETRVGLQRL